MPGSSRNGHKNNARYLRRERLKREAKYRWMAAALGITLKKLKALIKAPDYEDVESHIAERATRAHNRLIYRMIQEIEETVRSVATEYQVLDHNGLQWLDGIKSEWFRIVPWMKPCKYAWEAPTIFKLTFNDLEDVKTPGIRTRLPKLTLFFVLQDEDEILSFTLFVGHFIRCRCQPGRAPIPIVGSDEPALLWEEQLVWTRTARDRWKAWRDLLKLRNKGDYLLKCRVRQKRHRRKMPKAYKAIYLARAAARTRSNYAKKAQHARYDPALGWVQEDGTQERNEQERQGTCSQAS